MSLDAERSENMGRPKGSASIYDEGPRSARGLARCNYWEARHEG